jgi:hypothetical protein
MSRRRMRAIRSSKAWLYGGAAVICVALTVAGMAWVGGRAHVLLGSAELARERSTAEGPVDIVVTPSVGRVAVRNTSPLALLVLAYPEPEGQALVDRRYAVVPAHGSQTFGLVQGTGLGDSGMRLMYAPAVVPGDWLYPLARDWGPALGFVVLSAMQFGLAALALLGLDMAMAGVRR